MKSKLLYIPALLLGILLIGLTVRGQGGGNTNYFQPNIFPLSPNSTAFTKFGNYPVSQYSGLPDISIPLYTIETGGLSVPITLSYHASGNKVADVASWVGLGWSINTGGSITRSVMGLPDDNAYLQDPMRQQGIDHLRNGDTPTNSDLDYFHSTIANRGWDNMPDIFSYQIPGYSGKFFFDCTNNNKVEKIPFSPIKISGLNGPNGTGGFYITDTHGNQFTLGNTYREQTATLGGGTLATNGYSAWMLEQMISQNRRDTISFSYTNHSFQYPDGMTETQTIEDSYIGYQAPDNPAYVNAHPAPVILNNPSTVVEQQLQTIKFRNGKVDFILSTVPRGDLGSTEFPSNRVYSLDSIKVSTYNFGTQKYEVQKTIVFSKSYFNPGVTGAQRLKLDAIQILDKAGSIAQNYSFTYNTTLNLPPYQSFARDYWGYYNGKNSVTDLIPQTTVQINTPQNVSNPISYTTIGSNDPASRNPDPAYMQANILTQINYPTGGYSVFTYQTNQYYDNSNQLQFAGGLRISSISSYDSPSSTTPVLVKTYQYDVARANFINGQGDWLNTGIFQNSQTYRYFATLSSDNGALQRGQLAYTKRVRQFFAQPNEDLAPDAIPVTYSKVTEYDGTSTNNIGKTVYTFSDSPHDDWQTAHRTGLPISYNFSFSRGLLIDKATYMNKNGNYQIVKDEQNGYSAFPIRYYDGVGLAIGQMNYNDGFLMGDVAYPSQTLPDDITAGTYPYNYYAIVSDDNYLTGTTTTTYDMADITKFVTSSVTYNYDDTTHLQLVKSYRTDSKGNTRTSINKYPYNYAVGNAIIDTMVNRNMLSEAIEKTETYTTAGVTATTASQLNQYQFGNIPYSVMPAKVSILNIAKPVADFTPSAIVSGNLTSDSRYTQMISFDQFDLKNNISQYTTRNSTPTSILWDYQYELPVAQVKNATYSTVIPQEAYTSFEAPRTGGWLYSGTPIADVTAPTGSLVYPLSAGSVTLSNYNTSQSYVLSLWSNGAAPSVYTGSTLAGIALRTANGWTYYEYQVPASSAGITISGSGISIDELRLYPTTGQMTTYTYDPSGLRQIADTKGQIGYFEYDPFSRLKNVKDWNGNIVKNYGYHTYDQVVGNDVVSATFTRSNCPQGYSGSSATLSAAANTYYSSTKASANAEAKYLLQESANKVCTCTLTRIPVVVHNTTSLTFSAHFVLGGSSTPYTIVPGDTTLYVLPATYDTLTVASNSATHTYTLGGRPPQNVISVSFSTVVIATASPDLTLTIN